MGLTLVTSKAQAYVLRGHWVADCPNACGQTQFVFQHHAGDETIPCRCMTAERFPAWFCEWCHHIAEIDWPPNMAELMVPLNRRPHQWNRNWYPAGHPFAMKAGIPDGQTVDDLWDENDDHEVN